MTSQQIHRLATQEHGLILDLSLEVEERFGSKKNGLEYILIFDLWKSWIKINDLQVNVQPHSNLKSFNLNICEKYSQAPSAVFEQRLHLYRLH